MAVKASTSITIAKDRDTQSVTRFYKIAPSTSTPTQPTGTADPSGWQKVEPTYDGTSTNSLYFTDRTIFTDGTVSWSPVSKHSSYEAAKESYNKALAAEGVANVALSNVVETVIGTQSVSTRFWTGTCTILNSLTDGAQITYWIPYASKSETAQSKGITANELVPAETVTSSYSNDWLKLTFADGTTSAWIPIYYGGTTRLTTHYGANNAIHLTYRTGVSSSIPAGWWADGTYYSNTSYSQYANYITAGANGIKGYNLVMKDGDNTWSCFYTGAWKTTNTGKPTYTGGFRLGKILYISGAGAQTSNSSLDTYYNYKPGVNASTPYDGYPLDFRYSSNCATTLTAHKPVYLVGTIDEDDGLFYLDTTQYHTQTIPTAVDGKTYIYIGDAYSTYQVWLSIENPAYQFYDGKFRTLEEIETLKAKSAADQANELAEMKNSIYYGGVEPTLTNAPYNTWAAEERESHVGDLYYDTQTGKGYRFVQTAATTYAWVWIENQELTEVNRLANDSSNWINQRFTQDPDKGLIISENVGETATGTYVSLNSNELGFWQGGNKVAYFSGQALFVNQTIVLDQMDLGQEVSKGGKGKWSWKIHDVGGRNNLYLKWLG